MEYTIQKLALLAGVSTRTLRWYEQKGLLKPSRNGENGYRLYGPAEVDRLQQILFYRALGVELARIGAILDDPSFDRLDALRGHLTALQAERDRMEELIHTVRQTIAAEERKENMCDQEKFEGFKRKLMDENEASFGAEARKKYGDKPVDEMNGRMMSLTPEQYERWTSLDLEIRERLAAAVRSGMNPAGGEGQTVAALHREWLSFTSGTVSPEQHACLADLYVQDQRFTAYYDREASGCAAFLSQAIHQWLKR
ncbi:MAG: MerR family transcriptional regulator [Oscillospiraceae bacterium]|nr:MerR family transcriptional regulator [Oscillospiraceae bacterium]